MPPATRACLNKLIGRIAKGGEIVLAGFYTEAVSFAFPPAFMKEARLRIAAEWAAGRPDRHARADRKRARCRWPA